MCGRYASQKSAADLAALYDAEDDTGERLEPNDDIRPTDPVPIVRPAADRRLVSLARWGLLTPWDGPVLFNARAETLADKPAFREAFARWRCLVPADGWYEWRHERRPPATSDAQPRRSERVGGARPGRPKPRKYWLSGPAPLAFAGLYRPPSGERPASCTIVTTAAQGGLRDIHDRMPLVLSTDRWPEWLTGDPDPDLLAPTQERTVAMLTVRPADVDPEYLTPTLF